MAQLPEPATTRGHVDFGRKNSTVFIAAFLHLWDIWICCGHEDVDALEWKARWKGRRVARYMGAGTKYGRK
jgi:hypothetical protein